MAPPERDEEDEPAEDVGPDGDVEGDKLAEFTEEEFVVEDARESTEGEFTAEDWDIPEAPVEVEVAEVGVREAEEATTIWVLVKVVEIVSMAVAEAVGSTVSLQRSAFRLAESLRVGTWEWHSRNPDRLEEDSRYKSSALESSTSISTEDSRLELPLMGFLTIVMTSPGSSKVTINSGKVNVTSKGAVLAVPVSVSQV
jgi:hypothetical protein